MPTGSQNVPSKGQARSSSPSAAGGAGKGAKKGVGPERPLPSERLAASDTASTALLLLGLLVLSLLVVGAWNVWMRGLGVLAVFETLLRVHFHYLIAVLLPFFLAALVAGRNQTASNGAKKGKKAQVKFAPALVLAGLLGVVGTFYSLGVHPYRVAQVYTQDQQTVEEDTSFAVRAPWVVANHYAQRDQGDIIGDRGDVHFVPASQDQATSRYTVLVNERGVLGSGGYEAVQTLEMPTSGTIPASASTFCSVPESMGRRLGSAWPWHSLAWSIHARAPFAHWDADDAYGYCEGDEPVIVVPLYGYEGFWSVTRVPQGAAVYRPSGLEVLSAQELVEAGIEGPTYPRSLAEIQRKAINAGGSLGQWWGSKYGYDLTDTDAEDANAQNPSEFTLVARDSGEVSYVTPLTPRGSSQSMTALSLVSAVQQGEGRATLTVNTATDLPATSTLVTAIKESSVQGDSSWATRWSAGMGVYEILPGKDGHWVASIGQGQAVSYRADIFPDGRVSIVNVETGAASAPATTVDAGRPLSQMTEAELLDLIQEAVQELEKRQGSGS